MKYMTLGLPVATKPSRFAVGFSSTRGALCFQAPLKMDRSVWANWRVSKARISNYVSRLSVARNYLPMHRDSDFCPRAIISLCSELKVSVKMTKLIYMNIMENLKKKKTYGYTHVEIWIYENYLHFIIEDINKWRQTFSTYCTRF